MKAEDYKIECSPENIKKGSVFLTEEFSFEVYGPFGQGYNIKVKKRHPKLPGNLFSESTLSYHWRNGHISEIKTLMGKYGVSDAMILKGRTMVLEMDEEGNFQPILDEYAIARFVINHFFFNKTGPFKIRNA